VSIDEAMLYASTLGVKYYEADAHDRANVESIFESITNESFPLISKKYSKKSKSADDI
jgi:hypothetical protein